MAEVMSTGDVQVTAAALRTAYANGVLAIFGEGTQPASGDAAETGTLLCLITLNGGAFTGGVATNGLNFDTPVGGVLNKVASEVWKGVGLAAAGSTGVTATHFRFYANAYVTGESASAVRFDGAISTDSSGELQMTNPVIVEGYQVEVGTFSRTVNKA